MRRRFFLMFELCVAFRAIRRIRWDFLFCCHNWINIFWMGFVSLPVWRWLSFCCQITWEVWQYFKWNYSFCFVHLGFLAWIKINYAAFSNCFDVCFNFFLLCGWGRIMNCGALWDFSFENLAFWTCLEAFT